VQHLLLLLLEVYRWHPFLGGLLLLSSWSMHTQSLRPEKNFSDSLTKKLLEPCVISCMIPASAALKFSARESLRNSHRSHKFSTLTLFESPGSWWRLQIL
jgi:hypothetical protein